LEILASRCNVNIIGLVCNHFTEKINTVCGPTIPLKKIGKGFLVGIVGLTSLRILNKFSAINRFGMSLSLTV